MFVELISCCVMEMETKRYNVPPLRNCSPQETALRYAFTLVYGACVCVPVFVVSEISGSSFCVLFGVHVGVLVRVRGRVFL